ncbi:M48 family metalloprotease [Silanimonas lenta]|uniref:M48 family metalloprotease n=1 Tax=Silanimonas lenta TaxID=265429 RepID=UPI0003FDA44A|nr:M48 family metalloprotease [Silanimonas lenta]
MPCPTLRRPTALALALALLLPAAGVPAQSRPETLPQMGSSAATLITPADEARYGQMVLRELRRQDLLLDDPLVEGWLKGVGFRVAAASGEPDHGFTFFMLRDRRINAFATLGGLVGMNAGLVLTAEREDEVAGVLAHEVAHVTQRHVLRSVEKAQQAQLPAMLAMIGVIAAAARSDSASADDAVQAAVVGGQALVAQMQIDYTRSNESEADRIGIDTLHRAGFDPLGIADFFGRMERASRGNSGGWQVPEYLRSHPVTTTRVAEARDRAEALLRQRRPAPSLREGDGHLLLPAALRPAAATPVPASDDFPWARERLRVLSATSPREALAEYEQAAEDGAGPARRYGHALALMRVGRAAEAARLLEDLLESQPKHLWLRLAAAEASHRAGRPREASDRFEALVADYPQHRAVTLAYAEVLNERGDAASGRRAQQLLRPLLAAAPADLQLQQRFARASELAGDANRAIEAHAEAAFLSGRAEDALKQLDGLKQRDDVDYVQRARIEARMAEIMPVVLEMRRIGLRPQDQGRGRNAGP